jgi:CRP-like cAMP-binding protein
MKESLENRKIIAAALKKSIIFSALRENELALIIPFFQKMDFKNGEYIFMEGDPSGWLYIVAGKRVKILKHTLAGKDVILEMKVPGEMFCCSKVMDNKPYDESAQSKGDVSAIRIRRTDLLKLIDNYPILKVGLTQYLNERLTDAYDMMQNIATEIVERRIAAVLLKLSEKAGVESKNYSKIDFPLTRREIADMVGATTETVIRIMSRMEKQRIVKSSRNRILVKEEALQQLLTY